MDMMTEQDIQPQQDIDGEYPLDTLAFLQTVIGSPNLVDMLDDTTLTEVSQAVIERYEIDKGTMSEWHTTMEKAIDMVKMAKHDKTYPFDNASNVKYPLIVSAALQYNARAYPAIVPSGDPIQCKVQGDDADGKKAARAQRTARYSSYQLKTEMKRWERDTDRMTFIGPILGTVFRKYWYNPATRSNESRLCQAGKVIINNNLSDMSEMPAVTEELSFYGVDVEAKRRTGWFAGDFFDNEDLLEGTEPIDFIEQVMRFDLDDDEYPEPYVVTIHKETGKVVRMAAAFDLESVNLSEVDGTVLSIEANTYFTDIHFFPSHDGTFMGIGFGSLLSDISETINTTINMIMDSGHFSTMGGGFIGAKDFRIQGGPLRFRPGEWKHVSFRGNDVKAGMVPLTYPQPSAVMFQMLGMMIDAGKELSSTSNIMTGDANRSNMPVGTVMALIEQGMQVYTASHKRVYLGLKREFELLFRMNRDNLDAQRYSAFFDEKGPGGQMVVFDPAIDFDLRNMDIMPAADPKSVTDMQKMAKAQMLMTLAESGLIDKNSAMARVLEAAGIENIEELVPKPNPEDKQIREMQKVSAQLDLRMKAAEIGNKIADTEAKIAKAAKDISSAEAEEEGRNLATYLTQLRAMKEELDVGTRQIGAGGIGGVARAPGNGMGVELAMQAGGPQQAGNQGPSF